MSITSFLMLMLPAASNALYNFTPENASTFYDAELPTQYSLPESQLVTSSVNSFWSTHFLTSANSTEYVLLSQGFVLPSGTVINNSTNKNGKLSIKAPGFEFSSNSNDSNSTMVSSDSTDHYEYNLTAKATTRVLLNAGTGYFSWGNGKNFAVVSSELPDFRHVDSRRPDPPGRRGTLDDLVRSSEVKASIWLSDNEDPAQHLQFATVRTDHGLEIVRFNVTIEPENTWTSSKSNYTYQTRWFLTSRASVTTKIYAENSIFSSSPFTTVKGRFFGQEDWLRSSGYLASNKLTRGQCRILNNKMMGTVQGPGFEACINIKEVYINEFLY
ncbi:uncharacterized protein EAF02_002848 [Botrytis sinoallii]|uniref:uncharacterized protein n=1 Tax=Botrytis sinoallii TaxID=1463999 RepID=UPI0019016E7C|nr:uncharacterized protein EAF02_002848 [Botrytis sinoallii]KAF7888307.1 hypothetical protein EAF02_002848 [Botrytis sinoallii]